jgi:hypothetical protein
MITHLQRRYPINNLAHQGDTLEEIVGAGEYLSWLQAKPPKVRFLLFSAGGNDFLGEALGSCLNLFDPDHTDPSQAAYYLTPEFDRILRNCDALYRFLAGQVRTVSPQTKLVVHGYDYVNPWPNGIFLGKRMQERGLEPHWHRDLCRAIIHLMIDRFNMVLKNLANFLPNFIYVDLRGTLRPNDFFDEIHPKSAKAELLARKIARALGPPSARAVGTRGSAMARTKPVPLPVAA